MDKKQLALMILYDVKGRILLQDREGISKHGEAWGYFGGSIDEGETPENAVIRELFEELEFEIKNPEFLGTYEGKAALLKNPDKEILVVQNVFFKEITEKNFLNMVLHEGADMKWFSVGEARNLNMFPLNPRILDDFENKILNIDI